MSKRHFGALLHEARTKHGMSLRSLSAQSGIEFSRLSRIEHGTRPAPGLRDMRKLADLLSLNLADLLVAAGTPRETVEQLLWAERIRSAGKQVSLVDSAPRVLRAAARNRFHVKVLQRVGGACTVQLGTERWTVLSTERAKTLTIAIPPEVVQIYRNDPRPILSVPENVFAAEIAKSREIGSLRHLVLLVGGEEISAVLLMSSAAPDALLPRTSVYVAVSPAAIVVHPAQGERK